MASTIFFNGRTISVPGSYSVVDASGLEAVGLGASGIVAAIGTAEGGKPVSEITETKDFIRINKPEKGNETFRSGHLREVMPILFAPSKDPNILGGAVEVVAMKVNPATQSVAAFPNAYGDCLEMTSKDYGAFTSQITGSIGAGTSKGKLLSLQFEDVVESVDDLGGDSMFKLKYTNPGTGWDTMTAEVEDGGNVSCKATVAMPTNEAEVVASWTGGEAAELESTNPADDGQLVTLYGVVGTTLTRETLTLVAGVAQGVVLWDGIYAARVQGTTLGSVEISDVSVGVQATILPGTNPTLGLTDAEAMYVAGGKISCTSDDTAPHALVLHGYSPTGAYQAELISMIDAVTTVVSVGDWSEITFVSCHAATGKTDTLAAEAARSTGANQNTLQKVSDHFNGKYVAGAGGFVCALQTGLTTFNPANLDVTTGAGGPVDCLDPANPDFYADLWALTNWLNNSSALVSGAKATGAVGGAPTNTTAPVFLAGGSEGTTTFQDWQDALNLLKKVRINTIVPMTADPAVHAAVDAHCAYMGGIGRSERDACVGVMNTLMDDVATKDEVKAQIVDLNTRHVRVAAQMVERFNTSGEREEFPPFYEAAIYAGMQAGSPVGTSLTFKYMNTLNLRQHSSWNPTDDAEEMIQAGLCFGETIEGVGRRVVRNITTHLSSNVISSVEASVNEAANFVAFNFRTNMEFAVGRRGFAGTVNAAKGVAIGTLALLTDAIILTGWRSLDIELIVDILEVSVEVAPIIPINFVRNTIHLVTINQSAA